MFLLLYGLKDIISMALASAGYYIGNIFLYSVRYEPKIILSVRQLYPMYLPVLKVFTFLFYFISYLRSAGRQRVYLHIYIYIYIYR